MRSPFSRATSLGPRPVAADPVADALLFLSAAVAAAPLWGHLGTALCLAPLFGLVRELARGRGSAPVFSSMGRGAQYFWRAFFSLGLCAVLLWAHLEATNQLLYGGESARSAKLIGVASMCALSCGCVSAMRPGALRRAQLAAGATALSLLQLAVDPSVGRGVIAVAVFALVWVALAGGRPSIGASPREAGWRTVAGRTRVAAVTIGFAVPLAAVCLVALPALSINGWINGTTARATTGLSDSLTLGSIAELRKSKAPAFTARFHDRPPLDGHPSPTDSSAGRLPAAPAAGLYWRALVLDEVSAEGRWTSRSERSESLPAAAPPAGQGSRYTALWPADSAMRHVPVLEGTNGRVMASYANVTTALGPRSDGTYAMRTDILRDGAAPPTLSAMTAFAQAARVARAPSFQPAPQPHAPALDDAGAWLGMPAAFSPRTQALGRELARQHPTAHARVEALASLIRHGGYRYTLRPPPTGAQPLDDFLFTTRAGYCEHYASALVVVMRAAGVPARLATGYLSKNADAAGVVTVTEADAHAWAEAWMDDQGWVRLDPTSWIDSALVEVMPDQEAAPAARLRRLLASQHTLVALALAGGLGVATLWGGVLQVRRRGASGKVIERLLREAHHHRSPGQSYAEAARQVRGRLDLAQSEALSRAITRHDQQHYARRS